VSFVSVDQLGKMNVSAGTKVGNHLFGINTRKRRYWVRKTVKRRPAGLMKFVVENWKGEPMTKNCKWDDDDAEKIEGRCCKYNGSIIVPRIYDI